MTALDWLNIASRQLEAAGIGTARLDALVLLEDITKMDRAKILAKSETELSAINIKKLKNLLNLRAQHVPLAYVRGKTEFYGREFLITSDVLEPRPESETMIDELKKLSDLPSQPAIADIGTGSGALGITAKLELPEAQVTLIELDQPALKVAKINVDKFTLSISTLRQDLLTADATAYDVLLCNLPYVPDRYTINKAASHEPRLALFGGPDGLNLYRKLFQQLINRPQQVLYILCEALPTQQEKLIYIAKQGHYELHSKNDFILVFKRAQK
jgi:release factor glutamine methyltransferase